MTGTTTPHDSNCLTRTCLKWTADGELTLLDLELVLERLAAVEGRTSELHPQRCQPSLDPAA